MKKFIKWFGFLATAGTAAGVVAAYVLKNRSEDSAEKEPDLTEDEDYVSRCRPAAGRRTGVCFAHSRRCYGRGRRIRE